MFVKLSLVLLVFYASARALSLQRRESDECAPLHLVYLAGTTETGYGVVGHPLADGLNFTIPGTTSYAIPYNKSIEFDSTITAGARMTEAYLQRQTAKCPDQRFLLSGVSKGAMVLHRTNLTENIKNKVVSIVVFGDPYRSMEESRSWPIASPSINLDPRKGYNSSQNVASLCNDGDAVCESFGRPTYSHFLYPFDGSILVAMNFVNATCQNITLGGNSSTNSTSY